MAPWRLTIWCLIALLVVVPTIRLAPSSADHVSPHATMKASRAPTGVGRTTVATPSVVDLVVLFEQDTPLELIDRVRPKVLVKGADYRPDEVIGREIVEADGGEVVLVDIVAGHSTSDIVARSRQRR